jgi:uncharacterized Tic20 family protein
MSQTPDSYAGGRPTVSPGEERTMGTLGHAIPLIAMVVSVGVLGFLASLVLWFVYRDKGPFVRAHVANSLNIQIMTGIVLLVSLPLMLLLVGFVTWGLAIVIAFVLHVGGAVRANRSEWWDPPLTPHFVR